jgi:hypothetical protein
MAARKVRVGDAVRKQRASVIPPAAAMSGAGSCFGRKTMDFNHAVMDGARRQLDNWAFDILILLVEPAGQAVSKKDLMTKAGPVSRWTRGAWASMSSCCARNWGTDTAGLIT